MSAFRDALAAHPWPRVLGDVQLRFDALMLVGETAQPRRTRAGQGLWTLAMALLVAAVVANVAGAPAWLLAAVLVAASAGFFVALRTERLSRAQRRFVCNYATHQLRLDFHSPIAGRPRTLWVPFEDVVAVAVSPQAGGGACLLVDFRLGGALLREVLVADAQEDALEVLHRLRAHLAAAIGLGLVQVAEDPGVSGDPPKSA